MRTGGVVPKVFVYSLPELKHNGHKQRLSVPINIVAVEGAYRVKFYFSVHNPHNCKGLDPHGDFFHLWQLPRLY